MSPEPRVAQIERILGLDFFVGSLDEVCEQGRHGALVVAPSGPGLAWDLQHAAQYREALHAADIVLTDSSYLVLAWWLKTGRRIPRQSGLACLRCFLESSARPSVLWVMPDDATWKRSADWLRGIGWPVTDEDVYIAPHYTGGELRDEMLNKKAKTLKPDVIMIAIGGGTQERLALGLRRTLDYSPGIFCLGAAIGFLSGSQIEIPRWVDRWWLGWVWRIASNPMRYGKRYWRALNLGPLVLRFGAESPPHG